MRRATHILTLTLAAVAVTWLAAAPADAQVRRRYPGPDVGVAGDQRGAYDNGYREGLEAGRRDSRDRRDGGPHRHDAYRRADRGYSSWYGNRDDYRDAFRRGFEAGYHTAYRGGGYGYGVPPAAPYGGYGPPPARGDSYGYGSGYGYGPGRGIGFENGFNDGYREGLDASRKGRRYDPVGEKRYREGDHGYKGRYGSRDYYKRDYREGFRAGYDRAFREARGYGYGSRW